MLKSTIKRCSVLAFYFFIAPVINYLLIDKVSFEMLNLIYQFVVLGFALLLVGPLLKEDVDNKTTKQEHLQNFFFYLITITLSIGYRFVFMSTNQATLVDGFQTSPLIVILLAGVFGPIVEEVVFRGCLYNLIPSSKWMKIILSSMAFSLLHIKSLADIPVLPVYFFVALSITFAYSRHHNIKDSLLLHMFHNSLGLIAIALN